MKARTGALAAHVTAMALGTAITVAGGMGDAAWAQSEDDFVKAFAGQWQVVDGRFAQGASPCQVALSADKKDGHHPATIENCTGGMADVAAWGIADGQMVLFNDASAMIATLGGNQNRMSGDGKGGTPIILERVGAPGMAQRLQAAMRTSGCFYVGFSDDCAPMAQLAPPAGEPPRVEALVNLNVHAEARDEADVIGVIPKGSCVTTEICVEASDGPWCRAKFDGKNGWFRKLALRQNRWPVVTFENSCSK